MATVFSLTAPALGVSASTPPSSDPQPVDTIAPVATNDFMDLDRDLTQCISSNPLPGCGREPTSSGDRGGWQQLLLFGILIVGMGAIFGRVFYAVRKGGAAQSSR